MRPFATQHPQDAGPLPPDSVATFALAAGVAQAADWPTSTGGSAANAGAAGVHIARFRAIPTTNLASFEIGFGVNIGTTNAQAPASGTSVSSLGVTSQVPPGFQDVYQIPGNSTGYSLIASSSGWVTVEMWRR